MTYERTVHAVNDPEGNLIGYVHAHHYPSKGTWYYDAVTLDGIVIARSLFEAPEAERIVFCYSAGFQPSLTTGA